MALQVGELFAELGVDMSEFNRGMGEARRDLNSLSTQARRDFASIGNSAKLYLGIAAAALTGLATAAVATGIEFNALGEQAEVAFTTLLGSAEAAKDMIEDLKRTARDTPYEFIGLQNSAKLLLAMGFSAEQVQPAILTLGDAVAAIGGNEDTLKGVTLALGQMLTKGKVSAEEMNQLAERGIAAWDLMAEALGRTKAELMKAAEEGKLLASEGLPALLTSMQERYAGAMKAQSDTFIGMTSILKDSLVMTLGEITEGLFGELIDDMDGVIKKFNELSESGELGEWADDMGEKLVSAYETIKEFGAAAIDLAQGIQENWSAIEPTIAVVVAGFISMKVIGTITTLWKGYRTAVLAATAAQTGFLTVIGPVRLAFIAIATLAGIAALNTKNYSEAADQAARDTFRFAQSIGELNDKLSEDPLERSAEEAEKLQDDINAVNDLLIEQKKLQDDIALASANMSRGLNIQGEKEGDTRKLAEDFGRLNAALKGVNDRLAVFNITSAETGQKVLAQMTEGLNQSVNGLLDLREAEISELGVKNQQVLTNERLRDRYFELIGIGNLDIQQKSELYDVVDQLLQQYPSLLAAQDDEGRMIIHNTDLLKSKITADKEWVASSTQGMRTYLENLRKSTTAQSDQIRIQIQNVLALAKAHNAVAQSQKTAAEAANKAANSDPRFRGIKITDNSAFNKTVTGNLQDLNSGFSTISDSVTESVDAGKLKSLNDELNATEAAINNIDKALAELAGGGAKKNPFDGLGGDPYAAPSKDTKSAASSATGSKEDPLQVAFDEEIARIRYQAEMYDWSADQQIAALEKVRVKHKAYLSGNIEDERSILLQIKDLHEQVYSDAFNASVRWIDERKYYNQLSLEEELAAWRRMSVRYKQGSDERTQIDREVYRVQKEIHEQRIADLEAESDKMVDAAQKQLEALTAQLDAQADEVRDAADQRIENLRQQIQSVNDELERQLNLYNEQLKALNKLVEQEDRAKEADQFNQRVAALQDQIKWYEEQGADKFAFEIAAINRQIRDEQEAWSDQLRDWEVEDQKSAIQDAIDKARDEADGKIDNINDRIDQVEAERDAALAQLEEEKRRAQAAFENARDLAAQLEAAQIAAQKPPAVGNTLSPQSKIQTTATESDKTTKAITDAIAAASLKSITVITEVDSEKVAEKTIPIIGSSLSQPIRAF